MQDYSDFPPVHLFKKVLRHAPHSALLYASIWSCKRKGICNYDKKGIRNAFLISPTLFRSQLLAIQKLDLLSFDESDESFRIKFGAT